MSELPVTVTIYGSLEVKDESVLDLTRGEPYLGSPFDDEDHLLQHLAVNLIGAGHRLSQLDGFADLTDDAVRVQVHGTDAELHRDLAR